MYFKNFPKIIYSYDINGVEQQILLTDITTNFRFLSRTLQAIQLYDNYSIKDGETPESISQQFYGTPYYHWIIMLANGKFDYINDFPMSQKSLDKYILNKYVGTNTPESISFYVKNGRVVDYGTIGASAITNRVYENIVNESKREIKLISKDLIEVVLRDFNRLING